MSNKQESPKFNAQYIDQLLSGPSAGKAPEPPAEVPAPEPPKTQPTATRHPRRWILILTAFLVAVVSLCLLLPDLSANLRSAELQVRAEEAYSQLVSQQSHHFKLYRVVERAGEDRLTDQQESWVWGSNHLYITKGSGSSVSYDLERSGHVFRKEVSPEDPDAKWVYHGSTHYETASRPKTLADANYTIHSVRGTLTGTEVTYLKNESKDAQLTLKFNWDGTLVGITVFRKTNTVPYLKAEYTLLQTDSKEIHDKIKEAYSEAIQDKVNQK